MSTISGSAARQKKLPIFMQTHTFRDASGTIDSTEVLDSV